MLYECERCGYTTNRKSSIQKHFARINVCAPRPPTVTMVDDHGEKKYVCRHEAKGSQKNNNVKPECEPNKTTTASPSAYVCDQCGKTFRHRQAKYKHVKLGRCKQTKASITVQLSAQVNDISRKNQQLETKLAEQGETILKQQMQIKQLRERKVEKKSIKNYISYHTNNYTMNNYGSEHKTQTISTETYAKLCSKPYSAVCGLIREKHFNPEHPENHNVAITNANGSTCHVVDNGAFVLRNKGELANDMCFKNFDELHTAFREGVRELLEPFNRRSWMKFEEAWDSQPEVSHRIVEQVKLMCYNEPNKFTLT